MLEVRNADSDHVKSSGPDIGEEALPVRGKIDHPDVSLANFEGKRRDGFHEAEARDEMSRVGFRENHRDFG